MNSAPLHAPTCRVSGILDDCTVLMSAHDTAKTANKPCARRCMTLLDCVERQERGLMKEHATFSRRRIERTFAGLDATLNGCSNRMCPRRGLTWKSTAGQSNKALSTAREFAHITAFARFLRLRVRIPPARDRCSANSLGEYINTCQELQGSCCFSRQVF